MLSIIEHPAYIRFYDELLQQGAGSIEQGERDSVAAAGDLIRVGLKADFAGYDFEWPIILRDAEEELGYYDIDPDDLHPFTSFPLEKLRSFLVQQGETFVSQEVTTKTQFGKYVVTGDLFTARNYREYLQKILRILTLRHDRLSAHREWHVPTLQINDAQLIATLDRFIRTRLFGQPFDPFSRYDWKILLAKEGIVTKHLINEMARAIYQLQDRLQTTEAEVVHRRFSEVPELRMRESFSLVLQKTLYERAGYPSHHGGFERDFLEFLDRDADVERFLKISESQHSFAVIYYLRNDGLMATYHPDFLAGTQQKIYLIETKGNDRITAPNVRHKQTATLEWIRKINALPPEQRMHRYWEYILLSEDDFYGLSHSGATLTDICDRCQVAASTATGRLFD